MPIKKSILAVCLTALMAVILAACGENHFIWSDTSLPPNDFSQSESSIMPDENENSKDESDISSGVTDTSRDEESRHEESSEEASETSTEEIHYSEPTVKIPEEPECDLSEYSPMGTEGAAKIIVRYSDVGEKLDARFFGNTEITDIYIEDGITQIMHGAFYGCTSLKSIRLPNTLVDLGSDRGRVFRGCTSLESIYIPDGITIIENETFYDCASLKYVRIPDTVQAIELWAFLGTSITEIKLPEALRSIGRNALPSQIEVLSLPDNITDIFSLDQKAVFVKQGSKTHETVENMINNNDFKGKIIFKQTVTD